MAQEGVLADKVNFVFELHHVIDARNARIVPAENAAQFVVDGVVRHRFDLVQAFGVRHTFAPCNGIVGSNFTNPLGEVGGLKQVVGRGERHFVIRRLIEVVLGILHIARLDVQEFFATAQRENGSSAYKKGE